MRKFPEYYNIVDENGETSKRYFLHKYDELPSKYTTKGIYKKECLEWFLKNGYTTLTNNMIADAYYGLGAKRFDSHSLSLLNEKEEIIVRIDSNRDKEKSTLYAISLFYNCNKKRVEDMVNWEELDKYTDITKSNIFLVVSEDGELAAKGYDLKVDPIDVVMSYGKKFEEIHKKVVEKLNTDNGKGIILLHGDPGTGKTTYIKYLTKLVKDKEILFIPPSMAESLSEPTIIPFLMDHKNSILIIEDAEKVISDRSTTGSSAGVSNILNLTDGILGDCLGIQIIATFNMERNKIDNALLRKGRLIAEHRFSFLTVDETNILLAHLGKKKIVEKGMTLADIYNIDEEEIKSEDSRETIGFRKAY